MVRTAFAFAAAARKSSTDFISAAERSTTSKQDKIDKDKFFIGKGLIEQKSEDCVEDILGKVKTRCQISP
jgi:hypothetical protein